MSIHSRALGHDEEPRAFTTCVVQAAEAPQERVARRRKLRVCEDVTDSGEGAHVEVTSDEVDVVLQGVKTSKKMRLRRRASWQQHCEHGLSRT